MNDKSLEVLSQYDLVLQDTKKGRGALILYTDKGIKFLREYIGSGRHIEWAAPIIEAICEGGQILIDKYVKNNEGEYVSEAPDKKKYIVKEWFEYRECDVRDSSDIVNAVRLLAKFHKKAAQVVPNEIKYKATDLAAEMQRHTGEIVRITKYLSKKKQRKDFESLALKSCESFLEEANIAQNYVDMLSQNSDVTYGICHGNYTYHNLGFSQEGPVITDCEKLCYGYIVSDLYHILRKILEKNDWDTRLGIELIEEYNAVNSLTDDDLRLLLALFAYPEKFWKLINAYFNSRKIWIPKKNLDKLLLVIEQNRMRLDFIECLQSYRHL